MAKLFSLGRSPIVPRYVGEREVAWEESCWIDERDLLFLALCRVGFFNFRDVQHKKQCSGKKSRRPLPG
jgi:hypothetical protein